MITPPPISTINDKPIIAKGMIGCCGIALRAYWAGGQARSRRPFRKRMDHSLQACSELAPERPAQVAGARLWMPLSHRPRTRTTARPPASRSRRLSPHLIARSEEHTSELQSLMRISYAVFCLKKKKKYTTNTTIHIQL